MHVTHAYDRWQFWPQITSQRHWNIDSKSIDMQINFHAADFCNRLCFNFFLKNSRRLFPTILLYYFESTWQLVNYKDLWYKEGRRGGYSRVNGSRSHTTYFTCTLKSHILQNKLTGHTTCQMVHRRSQSNQLNGFLAKTDTCDGCEVDGDWISCS
jgi:hypothetical protein